MKKSQAASLKSQAAERKSEISRHAISSAPVRVRPCLPRRSLGGGGSVLVRVFALFAAAALLLTGCKATETLAAGIATKNTSGNGTVVDTHIGINTETKIPEVRTLFISGDFATVKAGTNAVSYREESSASVWNASSITKKRFLSITLTDPGDVPAAIKAVAEVFKTAEASTAEKENKDAEKDEVRPAQ